MFNMRYRRQVNYHTIELPGKEYKTEGDIKQIIDKWIEDFETVYGKGVAYTKAGIEMVSIDIEATGKTVKPSVKRFKQGDTDPAKAFKGYRQVFFPDGKKDFIQTATYEYERLNPNTVIQGPAIIESSTSTAVIPPEKVATVDQFLNIIIQL